MKSRLWKPNSIGLAAARDAISKGGVIGLPTDTVYGLACSAESSSGVAGIYRIKDRPETQPLIVMTASVEDLGGYVAWDDRADEFAARFWPGPLTLVLPARGAGDQLSRDGTLGVRIPNLPVVLDLLRGTGALATTSANRHGHPPVPDAASALAQLPGLSGALAGDQPAPTAGAPSSILDLTRDQPVLLREGRLSARELGVSAPAQDPGIRRD
ncbi:MAG: L-threonylcarbamoyladenylate synthase [Candidatus Dormiibacterota bacterium]